MKKKLISILLTAALMTGLLPSAAFAAGSTTHNCGLTEGCIVCDVAELINTLPLAEEITVHNAASVIDQVHAIDRLKPGLSDDQYDELLTLVEGGDDGTGVSVDVPLRYLEAVEAIRKFGGNSLYIEKKFLSAAGSEVNVENAQVVFRVTNVDTNVSQTLTMSTMAYDPNALSGDAGFYSMNEEGDGWSYKYILPAGTYTVEEVSDTGATVDGAPFVTTSTTYTVNGVTTTGGATVTVQDGGEYSVSTLNTMLLNLSVVDAGTNAYLAGATLTVSDANNELASWTSPEQEDTGSVNGLTTTGSYTLSVTPPAGYGYPDDFSFQLGVNGYIETGDRSDLTFANNTLTVALTPIKAVVTVVDDEGNLLDGANVDVTDPEDDDRTIAETTLAYSESDPDWAKFSFGKKLSAGKTYTVKVTGPENGGYEPTEVKLTVKPNGSITLGSLKPDADGVYAIRLSETLYDLSVAAVDGEGKTLDGAVFKLDGGEGTYPSGEITNLTIGDHTLYVDTPPAGYLDPAGDDGISFAVDANGTITTTAESEIAEMVDGDLQVKFELTRLSFATGFIDYDDDGNEVYTYLPGAEVTLNMGGWIMDLLNAETGNVRPIEGLVVGTKYTVNIETPSPGYAIPIYEETPVDPDDPDPLAANQFRINKDGTIDYGLGLTLGGEEATGDAILFVEQADAMVNVYSPIASKYKIFYDDDGTQRPFIIEGFADADGVYEHRFSPEQQESTKQLAGFTAGTPYTIHFIDVPEGRVLPKDTVFTLDKYSNVSLGDHDPNVVYVHEDDTTFYIVYTLDVFDPVDADGDGEYDDDIFVDDKGTPDDSGDDEYYTPGEDGGLIEVRPDDEGVYWDDADEDGEFGGEGDNSYPKPEPSGSGSSAPHYNVYVSDSVGGGVKTSHTSVTAGATITLTVSPEEGYALDALAVVTGGGETVTVTDRGDGAYTFTMPAASVTITATFTDGTDTPDTHDNCPSSKFSDLDTNQWYHEATDFVLANGYMEGVGDGKFLPMANLSRAMMVQVLYNMEGRPQVTAGHSFADVAADAWYADAVAWAAANGIVKGYDSLTFGPEDDITREQMAAILYRYAAFKGVDVSARGDLSLFTDGKDTSAWALAEMQWAVGVGLLEGKGDGILDPGGTATRVEVAQIIMNYCRKILGE